MNDSLSNETIKNDFATMMLNQMKNSQFPDILQFLPVEESKKQCELYSKDFDIINKKGTIGGYTALHWASIKNDFNLIKYLVNDCKATIDSKASLGETPLFICVKNCNFLAIEFLINYGANVYEKDVYDRTIIHWSAYTGKTLMFYYLKKYHKLSINDADQFKQNALHIATACGHDELARYLINSKEFNLYDQDFNGNTVLHMSSKAGLPRLSWIIFNNSGRRLLNVKNKLHQTPLELISSDTSPAHKKIIEWLKFESKNTNDTFSKLMLYGTWLWRFTLPAYIYTLPLIFNMLIFNDNNLNAFKGLISYGTMAFFVYFLRKQSHRINHISGLQNPFFLGFFLNVFAHNYISYYIFYFGTFNITNALQLFVIFLTIIHSYSLFKILKIDPGYTKENVKKEDGSDYELKDLFRTNISNEFLNENEVKRENIFCENCLIVINKPTKHCKLCEHCCIRFDHHCLFLLKCIAINNHRLFILLLASSVTCIAVYLTKAFFYLKEQSNNLPVEANNSILYFTFSSTITIWLIILFITNFLAFFMLNSLLFFQLNILAHGFTAQFRPFNLKSMKLTFSDKLNNLKIFFFDSNEKLLDLYFKQAKTDYLIKKKKSNDKLLGSSFINMDSNEDDDNSTNSFGFRKKQGGHGHDCSEHGHSH